MDEPIDDDNIDLDSLQAQIDLELARQRSLVESWIASTSNEGSSSARETRVDQEKQIEELLRRPPRLGVGASVPASGTLGYEAVRLRGKLAGKKRLREEHITQRPSQSDEEEESRAGAIKKKPRIDPFEQGKGKKKARNKANAQHAAAATAPTAKAVTEKQKISSHPGALVPAVPVQGPSKAQASQLEKGVTSQSAPNIISLHPSESTTAGKKRKKRSKSDPTATASPGSSPTKKLKRKSPEVVEVILVKDSPPPTAASASIDLTLRTPSPPPRTIKLSEPHGDEAYTLYGVPLLNLDGPPPVPEPGSPGKRKRRRRKKKKGDHKGQAGADGDAMDIDTDAKEDRLKRPDASGDET